MSAHSRRHTGEGRYPELPSMRPQSPFLDSGARRNDEVPVTEFMNNLFAKDTP